MHIQWLNAQIEELVIVKLVSASAFLVTKELDAREPNAPTSAAMQVCASPSHSLLAKPVPRTLLLGMQRSTWGVCAI